MKKLSICSFILVGVLMSTFVGCTRYRWGMPVDKASFKTIYVAPAKNRAFVAQVQALLTRQIREEILRNGQLHLAPKSKADAILTVDVESYGRSIGAVYETDPDTAKSLSLTLSVKCELKNVQTGKVYFKERGVSHSLSVSANDYAQAIEFQKMPQVTRDVAKKIAMLVANVDE